MRKPLYLKFRKTLDLGRLGERECGICITYYPGSPGSFYKRNGDPGDPPEPAEANIISVACDGLHITELTSGWEEEDWFYEAAQEAYEAHMTPEEL